MKNGLVAKLRLGHVDGEKADRLREVLNVEGISVEDLTNRVVNEFLSKQTALDKARQNVDSSGQVLSEAGQRFDKAIEILNNLSLRIADLEAVSQISDSRINNLEVEKGSIDSDIKNKIDALSESSLSLDKKFLVLLKKLNSGLNAHPLYRALGFYHCPECSSSLNPKKEGTLVSRMYSVENNIKKIKKSEL